MRVVVAIPARHGSTRLPGKALALIGGEPMVVRVWRRCREVRGVARLLVATDDGRIAAAVAAAGGEAVLTAATHASGTDRIAEAVRGERCDLVVNVQGDEPFLEPAAVEALVEACRADPECEAATLATPLRDADDLYRPAVVKVLAGVDGRAVSFSRHPIPWREGLWEVAEDGWRRPRTAVPLEGYLRHVGTYAYRADFLQRLTRLAPTPGELAERLEQLRILEHGHRIRVVVTAWDALAVDTPEDLAAARRRAGG